LDSLAKTADFACLQRQKNTDSAVHAAVGAREIASTEPVPPVISGYYVDTFENSCR
jgi:hypothetical protein